MDIRKISPHTPVLVELNRIEESPGPYCMSFGFDMQPLLSSIESFGLIHLPFVVRNKEGLFDPVMGYRRLMALKELRWDKVPCMDLSDAGLSPMDLLLFNLHDNLSIRRLNNVEKGMVASRLRLYMSAEEIQESYSRVLQLSRPWDLHVLLKIEELPENIKASIAENSVSMNSLGHLLEVGDPSFLAVLERIIKLKFNLNQQIKFIDYIIDISIIDNRPIHQVLDEEPFLDLFDDKKINTPQKAKKMLELLKKRRFPFLFSCERLFQKRVDGLGLPPGVRIQHPSSFESSEYRLEILFKNGPALKEKIKLFLQIKDITKLNDPWNEDI